MFMVHEQHLAYIFFNRVQVRVKARIKVIIT